VNRGGFAVGAFAIVSSVAGCRGDRSLPDAVHTVSAEEHAVLAESFVSGDTADLGALLDPRLVVQPPAPDTPLQGSPARRYLLGLAANTNVVESRLHPEVVLPEGPFAYEQGIWELQAGSRRLVSRYVLRWRKTPAGWRIVLWCWGPFR
jgi:hypothetical protein